MTVQQIEVTCEAATAATLSVGGQVSIYVNMGTGGYYEDWLNSLPTYDSDESARDGGIAIGKYYMKAFNHVEGGGGSPKKRLV